MARKRPCRPAQPEDPKRKVLAHYFNLQSSLNLLANQPFHNSQQTSILTSEAAAANANINGIGEYLSSQLEPIYYNEHRQPDSPMATRVFQIPELLEMILESMEFIDILHMSETCHSVRDIIYASTKLQVKLFLKPMKVPKNVEMAFQSPLADKYMNRRYLFKGYAIEIQTNLPSPAQLERWVQENGDEAHEATEPTKLSIIFKEFRSSHRHRRIGKGWSNMLICQPPVKRMKATPKCDCWGAQWDQNKSRSISSKSGLTLDDLLTVAKQLFDKGCKWCLLAKTEDKRLDDEARKDEGMSISDDSDEIYAPLDKVSFKTIINLPD